MIDIEKVKILMELMHEHNVDVVRAEGGAEKIALARNASDAATAMMFGQSGFREPGVAEASPAGPATSPAQSKPTSTEKSVSSAQSAAAQQDGKVVTSELVGTFYRSPSPESPSFVEMGSRVKKGQVLCIVEAMKIMNEIESEVEGEVVQILVDNGQPVEFGTPLFIIREANKGA